MKVENHTKSTMILGQLLDREAVAKEQCDTYASALEDVYKKIAALLIPPSTRRFTWNWGTRALESTGTAIIRTYSGARS